MTTQARGLAVNALDVAIAASGLGLALLALSWRSADNASQPLDPARLALALQSAGVGPEALASAGCSASHATTAITQLREEIVTLDSQLETSRLALQQASNERAQLASIVRSGTSTSQQRAALVAAKAAEQAAGADLASAIAAVFDSATDGMPGNLVQGLDRIRSNTAHELPAWHLTTVREDRDWLAIRRAVASERIHQRLGEPVPPEVQAILLAASADPNVAAAKVSFETNGPDVAAAWNDAVWQK